MKALILAGGYARRLWPLTFNFPKPLLKVGGKPIIGHILDRIANIEEIDKIYIATNEKFGDYFKLWLNDVRKFYPKDVEIILEPTTEEKDKLGCVGGIKHAIDTKNINDDLFVILGDNIFEFSVLDFVYQRCKSEVITFGVVDLKNPALVKKFGVVSQDKDGRITKFKEKPDNPETTLASTGLYLFPKDLVYLITEYIKTGNNPDKPGYLIEWLLNEKKAKLGAFNFNGIWFDIGTPETLKMAKKIYRRG